MRELPPVKELSARACELWDARQAGDPTALQRIREHFPFPRLKGKSDEEILADFFTRVDAHQVIAGELGFGHWGELLEQDGRPVDPEFEQAVDAIVGGDLVTLKELLGRRPELVNARSSKLHESMLLHYVGANGVEDHRQKSPPNAVQICRALLDAGAEADALALTYDAGQTNTTLYLLASSDHPERAGVAGELVELLVERGANVEGLEHDGLPLSTAIAFGRRPALEALVRCGASLDSVVHAAASGDPRALDACFDGDTLRPEAVPLNNHTIQVDGPEDALAKALVYSAMHGQLDAVRTLLDRGADPQSELGLQQTALHWASFAGSLPIVELLVERGADPNRRDQRWNASAIGWADEGGHEDVIVFLRSHSDLDLIDASAFGDTERVRTLLRDESPDGADGKGIPLRAAAAAGRLEVVRTLLDAGADVHLTNPDGKTALDWAVDHEHGEVAELLRAAGR